MEADPFITTFPAPDAQASETSAVPRIAGYEDLLLIGRGGMGKVYRARHITLGRTVALKVLAHEPEERILARFAEEARAVAWLHHPNICPLFETGTVEGRPYFAQEYLEGGSLAQKFNGQPQEPGAAAAMVETLANAVQYSHEHGILHRDLKPGNILLAADGTPKVTDFGLAKELATADTPKEVGSGLTRTGEIVGTPGYMPPEQASGVVSGLGPTADVYALGAILYEALTGRPPFQAPDALQTLLMVLAMDPVSPRTLQPKVPRDLETICLKCLEKPAKRRYPTARALADDLARFRAGQPILARPVGVFERTAKWAKRKKALAALVGLSALFFLSMIAVAILQTLNANAVRQSNADLAAAKAELEATNADLLAAKSESDKSYALAVEALQEIVVRFSTQLFGVPLVERVMQSVLGDSVRLYQRLTDLRPGDRDLASKFASVLVLQSSMERSYSKFDAAARTRERVAAYLQTRLDRDPDDAELLLAKVRLGTESVAAAEAVGGAPELIGVRKKALADIVRFCERFPDHRESPGLRVQRYWTEAVVAREENNPIEQLDAHRKAAEAAREYRKAQPENPAAFISLHTSLYLLGSALELRGESAEADRAYLELTALLAAARVARPDDPQLKSDIAEADEARAGIAEKLLDLPGALKLYRGAEPLRRELILLFPLHPNHRYRLGNNLALQARLEFRGDLPSAKKKLDEAIAISGKLATEFPANEIFTIQDGRWRGWRKKLDGVK